VGAAGGDAGMVRLDIQDRDAAVSVNIAPEWRGRGVGPRALGCLSREAFGPLGLLRLSAVVKRENAASRIAFERAGFQVVDAGGPLLHASKARLRVVAAIQGRMGSTRLPGKVLVSIAGRPTIQRIAERVASIGRSARVRVQRVSADVPRRSGCRGVVSNGPRAPRPRGL